MRTSCAMAPPALNSRAWGRLALGFWLESYDGWRPVWYRVERPRVDASTPYQLPLADARRALLASLHFTVHGQSAPSWEALLPHFSAPALQRAQRVRMSKRALRFCALALAYARSDASTLLQVGKISENVPRPTLEEELFDFLRAASACSALLACCLALQLGCPVAEPIHGSCPCTADLAGGWDAAWPAHQPALPRVQVLLSAARDRGELHAAASTPVAADCDEGLPPVRTHGARPENGASPWETLFSWNETVLDVSKCIQTYR